MSSFLGNAPTPAVNTEAAVENDGWFPNIDPADLRKASRFDGTVTPERLNKAILFAVSSVNAELATWKASQIAAGHESLEDVPSPSLSEMSTKVTLYMRAVYAAVQADLVERYRDYDTTGAGSKQADAMEQRIADLRRDIRWAISDLLGIRRTTVELI